MKLCKNFTYNEKDAAYVAEFNKTKKKHEALIDGMFVCANCNHIKIAHDFESFCNDVKDVKHRNIVIYTQSEEHMRMFDKMLKEEMKTEMENSIFYSTSKYFIDDNTREK
jgi:hypothetical protein